MRSAPILVTALLLGLTSIHCAHSKQRQTSRPTVADRVAYCEDNKDWIMDVSKRQGVDPQLVLALIRVESHYNPHAISRAGAMGLMQVMPSTAKGNGCVDAMEPLENVKCGALVLSKFLKRYDGNLLYGLSAYNGGYRMATKPQKAQALPKNERYVDRILKARGRFVRGGCPLLMKEF